MEVQQVFQDGSVFSAAVLDIKDEVLIQKFLAGIPTEASLPHAFGNAFRNVAALIADADFTFKEVEEVKKFLENPEAYSAANPAAAAPAAGGGSGGAAKEAKAAVVEEEEEEE